MKAREVVRRERKKLENSDVVAVVVVAEKRSRGRNTR